MVDANVLMNCLISGRETYQQLFKKYTFYAPDFIFAEMQEHQAELLKKTHLSPALLKEYTLKLFGRIVFIPNFLVSNQSYLQAFHWCKDIDADDTPYLALAIEFDIVFVSKDDTLVRGLRAKGFDKIISFSEFLSL